jgi:hypothetical protein
MTIPSPVFIGFRVKRFTAPSAWLLEEGGFAASVAEICSVSECIAEPAPNWVDGWDFNAACCYNSPEEALAKVPAGEAEQYRLYAYRMFPLEFGEVPPPRRMDLAAELICASSPLPPEPDLSHFDRLGYDVAGAPVNHFLGFGCSPLSCNGCAAAFRVNRYCLIDDLDEAVRTASLFSAPDTETEPGPFYLYEVLRRR